MTYANGEQQNDDTVEIDMQEASAMTGLHLTTVLDKDACSEIAEALGLDQKEIEHIHRRLCNAKAHEDFGWLFTLSASAVFHNLKKMADNLAAIAMELELGGGTLQIFLDLALFCSGDIKQHPEVRQILNTLARYQFDTRSRSSARSADHSAPRPLEFFDHSKFFDACMERYQKSVDGNFTLALIEVLKEAVNRLQALQPETPRGSPGKGFRKAIICELAVAYHEFFGEAPTCTPSGRFMLLCELVLGAMGESTDGLEQAVQRLLRSLKTS